MDSNHLREFIMLAEKKNYAVAAEQLFISQSALSRHIQQLEDKLGVQLFERNPRKVSLTRYGETLLPYARQIISLEDEAGSALGMIRHEELNSIRVAAITRLAGTEIIDRITGFIAAYKDIAFSFSYASYPQLREKLDKDQVDFIITNNLSEDSDPSFRRLTLLDDRVVAVLPKDHTLSDRWKISVSDLANDDWLIQENDIFLSRTVADITRGSGITVKKSPVSVSGISPLYLAARGLGITFEQESVVRAYRSDAIVSVPLYPVRSIRIEMLWKKKINETAGLFVSYMKKKQQTRQNI